MRITRPTAIHLALPVAVAAAVGLFAVAGRAAQPQPLSSLHRATVRPVAQPPAAREQRSFHDDVAVLLIIVLGLNYVAMTIRLIGARPRSWLAIDGAVGGATAEELKPDPERAPETADDGARLAGEGGRDATALALRGGPPADVIVEDDGARTPRAATLIGARTGSGRGQ
jgi:hypothetical protein